nr:MAG TPA: holin [Caudoviricetes sp.]
MSTFDEESGNLAENIAQVSPSLAVSSAVLLGLPLSDWVYVITIIYTFVGICTMIKKHWVEPWLEKKRKEKNNGL